MELRVHGIGGSTPQAVLGVERDVALVPLWRLDRAGTSAVWATEADAHVAAYHWAPLTSGSPWFALWPLLLPFTILNVAGFMHPVGRRGRFVSHAHRVLCAVATAAFAAWLAVVGQVVAGPAAGGGDRERYGFAGAVAAALAVVAVSQVTSGRFERVAPVVARDGAPAPLGRRRGGIEDPAFFAGRHHVWLVVAHALVLAATLGAIGVAGAGGRTVLEVASDAVTWLFGAQLVLLLVILLGSVRRRGAGGGPGAWGLGTFAAAGAGVALIGGLSTAALRSVAHPRLAGAAFVPFDTYGWALLVALGVGVWRALATLGRASPGERLAEGRWLLPQADAWLRARVAQLAGVPVAALAAAAFVVTALGLVRWASLGGDDDHVVTDTPPVRIAQAVLYALVVFMVVNLVRSRLAPAALRRVGQVWDVLTFWPRRYHPFAVRPYAERAVPELQRLLVAGPAGPGPLTVVAHSQGAILVVAALAPLAEGGCVSAVDRLVTVGAPIRSLYARAFPAYVDDDLVERAERGLCPGAQWVNAFRFTDHVGRTAFGEEDGWAPARPGEGALVVAGAAAAACERRAGVLRIDCALPDPDVPGGPVRGHSDYW